MMAPLLMVFKRDLIQPFVDQRRSALTSLAGSAIEQYPQPVIGDLDSHRHLALGADVEESSLSFHAATLSDTRNARIERALRGRHTTLRGLVGGPLPTLSP